MATHPIPAPSTSMKERPLTHDEWWDLFDQLRLDQQPGYAEHGGPVAFFRKERDADDASC
jgi:hypothetical protein